MEYNVKQGYQAKLQSMMNNVNAMQGVNIDKLINDVSNVDSINYMYRVLSTMPNVDVNEVITTAMNNAILVKDNSLSTINNVCKWISIMDKSFLKVGKLSVNNAINNVGKGFKPDLIEVLRYEIGDKELDEATMIDVYNKVYDKKYKTIKSISTHDSNFFKNIVIKVDENDPKNKTFKLFK